MFPEEKRPLLSEGNSSKGVSYWKQLFQRQFPLCDTSIKNCQHLLNNDKRKIRLLELLMLDRDRYALDIGQVR
ncbi:hypothetical protein BLA29_008178 [Euroglyphus maynei]|uniref:PET domain-containing protein n=1 Tax=Euroglyphus maynei TaxID=6958 RepID=A0A1Y3BT16_EURMA|nr:hypothetical protein BLA29_008178 [Euroglyphus maynei]